MVYPSLRDWLFSVKTFAAAMFALYLGLAFQLPRPCWAMATVYIVSNPFVGATRSKALYRSLGTAIGASAVVLFVRPFVESPYLFSVVVALWTGTLLYLAVSERTARSYVFMLAGYTMPLIALPAVFDPTNVFDLAITRTEEILLGIVCASTVGSAIFPNRLAPSIIERTDGWLRDAVFYATETLSGRIGGASISASRHRQRPRTAAEPVRLRPYPARHRGSLPRLVRPHAIAAAHHAVAGRPADGLTWQPAGAPRRTRAAACRRHQMVQYAVAPSRSRRAARPRSRRAARTHRQVAAAACRTRQLGRSTAPECLVAPEAAGRCLAGLPGAAPPHHGRKRHLAAALSSLASGRNGAPFRPRHLFSIGSAVGAIVLACVLWISSGWNDGASAVTLVAVACCFFAALDEPAPHVFTFFTSTAMSVVLAGAFLFVVLPNVHDFPLLVIVFAGPFILVGTLIPRPQFNLAAMLVAVFTATNLSIQGAYDADFLLFLNGNLASLAGLLYAYLWTRVTRPFGAEFAAARLMRSSWEDVVLTASRKPIEDQRNLAARMLDRLTQLIPRLAATDDQRHPSIESFRDLRIAFNALDLRRLRPKLGGDATAAIDGILDGIRSHFETCIARRVRQPVPESLMAAIDAALVRITEQGLTHATSVPNAASAATGPAISARQLRDAQHALVGLRLSLFPATITALAPPASPNPEPAA